MPLPVLEAVDKTSFTLAWETPEFIGGCPIEGYQILRDDGAGGEIDIQADDGSLSSRPDLFQHTVDMDASLTGL
jgi:hypothetical protein